MTSRSCVGSDNVINGVAGYGYFAVSYPIPSIALRMLRTPTQNEEFAGVVAA